MRFVHASECCCIELSRRAQFSTSETHWLRNMHGHPVQLDFASAKRLWDSLRGVRGGSFSPCPIDGILVVEACICRANRLTSRSPMFWAYAGSVRPQAAVAKAPALSPLRTQRSAVGGLQMGKGIEFPAVSALLLVPKLKAHARMCAYRHAFSRASMCLRHACWHA